MIPMTRQSVSSPVDNLHRELDRAFDRLWGASPAEWAGTASYPVDIHEDDDAIHVEAELPGFTKDEIDITMEQGVLTISAQHQQEEEKQGKGERHLSERQFRRVARSFRLPSAVDENNVEASLSDGVLNLRLPKREEVKPRRISVK